VNSRESIRNDFGLSSGGLNEKRSGSVAGRVLKGLLVIGVAWVVLNVVFAVAGALTSSEGIEASEASVSPGSVRMITEGDWAAGAQLVIVSEEART
jgi:hypothetical protein